MEEEQPDKKGGDKNESGNRKEIIEYFKSGTGKKDELMKIHTTFRVGGPASYFVTPETEEEVAKVIEVCTQENVPYYIVGNGSNLLVSDQDMKE